ncbi:hypothetical protein PLESTB_001627500 [Pleodorina starrii]|uniref:Transmembrane protein n=1 Tax=Pleodorina starrii TaxID=330485 RepID=A0A9W6BXV6_9CHLO|nr:hypothetical protein PLESTM_000911300 [Pleodorina starrii]GLC60566.1 hypothetical protein PLESTB_001627500 [Pleodorina starrii]GLC77146.1 hypothetical protein PLESTF_001891200 [Pleodorina starrii]
MSRQLKQGEFMETDVLSPPSPRSDDHNGWTLVDRPAAEGVAEALDIRPRAASPGPDQAGEAPADQEELQDGLKSPESERLADDVLREPFQAGGPLQLQLAASLSGPNVEEPSTPTAGAGPHAASCGDLTCCCPPHFHVSDLALALGYDPIHPKGDHSAGGSMGGGGCGCGWGFDRHHPERLRAVSRLSGEGALEGFQDPQDLLFADSAAPGASARISGGAMSLAADEDVDADGGSGGGGVSLGWESLLAGVWGDLLRELDDVKALVSLTAAALWERVQQGLMAVEDWAAAVRESANKAAKSMGRPGCPLWTLIGLSGLAAVALAALAAQLVTNRRLALQLRQRDKDLARLVVKILNLQDALHSASRAAAGPSVLRPSVTLIGMV